MNIEKVTIPVDSEVEVSGIIHASPSREEKNRPSVILSHGAGNDMNHPLIVALTEGFAAAGMTSLRFNFPYKEKGKKAPDRQPVLEATWLSAYSFFKEHPRYGNTRIAAAGKSMGGRIASQLIAEGRMPASRLILLGYPLHPAGKKDRLRDAHLNRINIPVLLFAGTRDPLCDLDLMRGILKGLKTSWTMKVIEGGDHSFKTPKSSGLSADAVTRMIVHASRDWLIQA